MIIGVVVLLSYYTSLSTVFQYEVLRTSSTPYILHTSNLDSKEDRSPCLTLYLSIFYCEKRSFLLKNMFQPTKRRHADESKGLSIRSLDSIPAGCIVWIYTIYNSLTRSWLFHALLHSGAVTTQRTKDKEATGGAAIYHLLLLLRYPRIFIHAAEQQQAADILYVQSTAVQQYLEVFFFFSVVSRIAIIGMWWDGWRDDIRVVCGDVSVERRCGGRQITQEGRINSITTAVCHNTYTTVVLQQFMCCWMWKRWHRHPRKCVLL